MRDTPESQTPNSASASPLRCEDAALLASRELDGELTAQGRSRLDAHVAACPACARERAGLAQADGWLRDALAPEAFGSDLVRDVMRTIELRQARPAAAQPAPRGILVAFRAAGMVAAAAAAVIFILATGSLSGPGPDSHAPAAPVVVAKAYGAGLRAVSADATSPRAPRSLGTGDLVHADEPILNTGGAGTIFLGEPARIAAFDPNKGDDQLTRIDIRPDTALSFHVERDGGITVSFAASGVAFFEVAHQDRPFRVSTSALTATVLGTKFLVQASSDASLVSVVEGRVRVTTSTQHVVLSPRQEGFVAVGQGTLLARPSEPRALLAWNPRMLATLAPAPAAPAAPSTPAVARPADPTPKPAIDPNLDTPVK